jgi:two-component system, cell cycle response regulator
VQSGPQSRLDGRGIHVLVAEDDASSRFRLQAALREWGYEVTCVADGRQAIAELARPDGASLAVLDWSMPEADGLEVCRTIRTRPNGRYVYAILLTAHDREEDLIAGFDAGADDYVTKPFNTKELRARVRSGARIVQLQHQLVAAREELREKAMHDPLTGLLTRGAFFEMSDHEFARARRSKTPLSVVMADIDHFKSINDRFGHPGGDEVLRELARRLQATFRKEDAVGRYGGEEFVALAVGCDAPDALALAERFRHAVNSQPFAIGSERLDVTTSVGVVTGTAAEGIQGLVRAADEALYRAKATGRDKVVCASDLLDNDSANPHDGAACLSTASRQPRSASSPR